MIEYLDFPVKILFTISEYYFFQPLIFKNHTCYIIIQTKCIQNILRKFYLLFVQLSKRETIHIITYKYIYMYINILI